MSRIGRYRVDPKTGEATGTTRDEHPRELSYSVGTERFKMLTDCIQSQHKDWTKEDCRRAAIEELSKGLLGHISSVS